MLGWRVSHYLLSADDRECKNACTLVTEVSFILPHTFCVNMNWQMLTLLHAYNTLSNNLILKCGYRKILWVVNPQGLCIVKGISGDLYTGGIICGRGRAGGTIHCSWNINIASHSKSGIMAGKMSTKYMYNKYTVISRHNDKFKNVLNYKCRSLSNRVLNCDIIFLQTFPFELLNLVMPYTQLLL